MIRSKTKTGRVLPISHTLQLVIKRRRRLQYVQNARVFSQSRRNGSIMEAGQAHLAEEHTYAFPDVALHVGAITCSP